MIINKVKKNDLQDFYQHNSVLVDNFHRTQTVLNDVGESNYFLRELKEIEPRVYETKYKKNKYTMLIPVDTSGDPAARTTTYQKVTKVGQAKIVEGYADDVPSVDTYGEEVTRKVYQVSTSFGYSRQEIREARRIGRGLEQRKPIAARGATEEKLNRLAFLGDSDYNIPGFINYPGISEYTVPNGTGGNPEWNTKTPDEVLADLNGIVTGIIDSTNGVEVPDTILLPIKQYEYIKNTRMTGDSDRTILKFFLENNQHIKTVEWLTELSGAGAGGSDRFLCYSRTREVLSFKLPLPYQQLAPQVHGFGFQVLTETRAAGTTIYYPQAVAFGDNI